MTTNKTGQLVELQANGGGYITEAFPTNFHTFATRRPLVGDMRAEDYREVSAAERAAIVKSDAKWVRPTPETIKRMETLGAKYNERTGFFELNGLVDLTEAQMFTIVEWGKFTFDVLGSGSAKGTDNDEMFRTNVLASKGGDRARKNVNWSSLCYNQYKLEIFCASISERDDTYLCSPSDMSFCFTNCGKLREIKGTVNLDNVTNSRDCFVGCTELTTVHFHKLTKSIDLKNLPAISNESLTEMVQYAINTTAITVTLHADAYARLTEELIAKATEKQISFVAV